MVKSLLVYKLANDNVLANHQRIDNMATNPSKLTALTSPEADNSNNAKQPSDTTTTQEQTLFEQFQHDLLVMKPALVSEDMQRLLPFANDCFPKEITTLTISYMGESEIPRLAAIASPILFACHSEVYKIMGFKKLVSENLLPHVFNANLDGVDAFLRTPSIHPKILLTESHYAEGYESKKSKKFIAFGRHYKAVSALKGAYRTGDGPFLGRRILAYLLRDNNLPHNVKEGLLCEARQQLTELLALVRPKSSLETVNAKTSAETPIAKVNVNTATATAASAATAVSSNDTANNKEKAEFNSNISANTDEFRDTDEFLSAIVNLINAYNAYTSQYDSLATAEKWTEIEVEALWGEVCECQKLVYHYVKLEFFGPTPFSPLPAFDIEPPRGPCRYYNNEALDLDEIGRDTFVGLYKGGARGAAGEGAGVGESLRGAEWCLAQLDLAAISHLYKLRVDDLRNTIDHLHSLESALIFLNDVKPALRIDL